VKGLQFTVCPTTLLLLFFCAGTFTSGIKGVSKDLFKASAYFSYNEENNKSKIVGTVSSNEPLPQKSKPLKTKNTRKIGLLFLSAASKPIGA